MIDAFASEIGELKQEMVHTPPATEDQRPVVFQGPEGEVSGLYLQSRHSGREGGERDSGYDSLGRRMSVLDRLTQSHPVWLLLTLGEEEARRILLKQPPGVFLVRRCATRQRKVLSVRLDDQGSAPCIGDFPVRESQYTFFLEHSGISFADLFRLVAFYCISRDVLPFALRLPDSIACAKTQKGLEEVAQLGAAFWDSALSQQQPCAPFRPLSRTLSPQRSDSRQPRGAGGPPGGARGQQTGCGHASAPPTLRGRPSGSSLCPERSPSAGPLCFVNPLFFQAHRHHRGELESLPDSSPQSRDAKAPRTLPSPRRAPLIPESHVQDAERHSDKVVAGGQPSLAPPQRPPPPRFMPSRRPAPPPPAAPPTLPAAAPTLPAAPPTLPAVPQQPSATPPPPSAVPPPLSAARPPLSAPESTGDPRTSRPPLSAPESTGDPRTPRPPLSATPPLLPAVPPPLSAPPPPLSATPSPLPAVPPPLSAPPPPLSATPPPAPAVRPPLSAVRPPLSAPPPPLSAAPPPLSAVPPPLPAVPPASAPKLSSMPETIPTNPRQPPTSVRRPAPRPPSMGTKSSSLAKKANAPPVPPSNPPPPRPTKKPDLEAHRCHVALDDETIAKAISRAKPPTRRSPASPPTGTPLPEEVTGSPPGPAATNGGGPRCLSDVSMSTSSSDSLDYSRSPGFSLGLPPAPVRRPRNHGGPTVDSSEEDEEEEEEEEEDEEEDYGVGLENDMENGFRRPFGARRRKVGVRLSRGLSGGGSFVLPRALKGKFRRMSGVLGSLMTPERRAVKKITELSREKGSYFGSLVQDYVCFVQENRKCHTTAADFLQTIRQFMTQMKAYLRQSSELDPPLESLIPEDQIDHVLEKAMHKCVLKPLKASLDVVLHDFQVSSGAWQQLKENLALAKAKRPLELGVDGVVPPDAVAMEKIRHKFLNMRKMYSPEKKVSVLLRVCKLIYTIMQDNSGRMYGADDFLPMLTYVLAQCDLPQLDTEIQYMMELLDPCLLHGEAQRAAPSVDDFQNYLRVTIQEVDSGCTAKTLLVQPYSTTEEVCSRCAYKFRVADPENYALFLLNGDTSQQLAPDTHPQQIKSEIHGRPRAQAFHFAYRRVVGKRERRKNG
ncbi:hypothetical protein NHX12_018712 [Muraenolepis orangiensis]|uniref:Ras and Rab interactor 2 n=1 Tax=Muraenolepis orangiensis TaxID=630683 RepID=A0A9Q0IXU2_9TELE|nr:hypothetical protein NHX12_018712 [Muraenolepis orangiensis]